MRTYQYEAIQPDGAHIQGTIEAESLSGAKTQLRAQGYLPISIKEQKKYAFSLQRFSQQDLTLLTRQLATLLSAGIPIEEALLGVCEQTEKTKVKAVLVNVRNKVLEGFSLAQALGEHRDVFPELYRTTIGTGEHSGRLDSILEDLADYTEKQQAMKQKVQHALIYPLVMITVSILIITFLLIYIVPTMIQVFADTGQPLPRATRFLMAMSHVIQHDGIYLCLFLLSAFFLGRHLLNDPKNSMHVDAFLLKLPGIAYFIRTVNVARYIRTFSMLFAAGVNVLDTMKIAAHLIQNAPMRIAFEHAVQQVREGRDIHAALKDTHYLPPMALHLIANGEKSGELAAMMQHAATHLEQNMSQMIATGLTLLEPLMIIIMGGMVLFIVLATLLPIFSMEQLVG